MVRRIERELIEQGPSATDDRKVRFLTAAYLRDIRDLLRKQSGRVVAPPAGSAWDVQDMPHQEEDGDTRPFAFIEELRVGRPQGDDPDKK
jgi:hypothetical protein